MMFLPTNIHISEVQLCPYFRQVVIFGISPKFSFALIIWIFVQKLFFFSTFFFISWKVWVPNDYESSGQLVCLNCNFLSKVNVLLLNFDLRQHAYPTKSVENWEFTFKKLFCWIEGIKVKICPCAINIPWKCSLWS